MILIEPSWVLADHTRMAESVAAIEAAGADRLHVDFMDGRAVPNFGVGVHEVKALRTCTRLPLHFHLMVEEPIQHIESLAGLGATIITVHPEACSDLKATITEIRSSGLQAGVALIPDIPTDIVKPVLPELELVLVFLIRPGFTGQTMKAELLEKVRCVRELINLGGSSQELLIDGGVRLHTIEQIGRAGGDSYVVGSVLFNHPRGLPSGIQEVRQLADQAYNQVWGQYRQEERQ
jgi:ribulose-phosphate 3-epimerase